jgi:hypothetical protein
VATRAAATDTKLARTAVPLELEEGPMPLNTFSNKAPFKAKVKSVERIVGPKATGETCNIIIETEGKIPFWEGQSYGVIPPVRAASGVGLRWWCDQGAWPAELQALMRARGAAPPVARWRYSRALLPPAPQRSRCRGALEGVAAAGGSGDGISGERSCSNASSRDATARWHGASDVVGHAASDTH